MGEKKSFGSQVLFIHSSQGLPNLKKLSKILRLPRKCCVKEAEGMQLSRGQNPHSVIFLDP